MELPARISETLVKVWPSAAAEWIPSFKTILAEVCQSWQLEDIRPFPNLSYNFVARAQRGGGTVVLKLAPPNPDFNQEASALRAFDRKGCVRLLEFDPGVAAMLLEDVRPGTPLEQTWIEAEDEVHTRRIADAMLQLWRAPTDPILPSVRYWLRCLDEEQPLLPHALVSGAKDLCDEVTCDVVEPKLLHGDLHHGNLLESQDGFIAIDPKGVVGDPAFEVYALLHNPVGASAEALIRLLPRRLEIVSEATGISLKRLKRWGFVGLVMSLCWSAEEGEIPPGEVELTRQLAKMI